MDVVAAHGASIAFPSRTVYLRHETDAARLPEPAPAAG